MAEPATRPLTRPAAVTLLPLAGDSLARLLSAPDDVASERGFEFGPYRALILETAGQTRNFLARVGEHPPWIGYLAIDPAAHRAIGTCAFKGPPDDARAVEIAYFTFPDYEGRGYATAMACALVALAAADSTITTILAHTLPEPNASGSVLRKAGFVRQGEVLDPDDGRVWRYIRPARLFSLDEAVPMLAATPHTLRSLLATVPESWVDAHEGGASFSARDVLGHLISGERTDWMARVEVILAHGESREFTPFDRFGHAAWVRQHTLGELLNQFEELRAANLERLGRHHLSEADLDRLGRHPDLGPVSLRQLLATWVVHDLDHLGQVARVMAKRYTDLVGPWKAYLPILTRR